MNVTFSSAEPLSLAADAVALPVGKDLAGIEAYESALGAGLADFAKSAGFSGSAGTALILPSLGRVAASTVILAGVGEAHVGDLRKAALKVGREARALGAASLVSALELDGQVAIEALSAGNYTFDRYKKEDDRKAALTDVTLPGDGSGVDAGAALVRAKWQSLARDLVNLPAADLYPESLAQWTRDHLGALEGVEVEVWDEDELAARNCVGIIAVGQGSVRQPRLIRATYRPENAKDHIALVGKGVTFDAGGLSLKPSPYMQTMRCDMGGSATVLAAFGAAVELGLPVALDVFVGAAENMVDGNSFKLGDVLTYNNGVTVEIHNTDAEGRLVLADCLIEACKVEGVNHLVDAATLTGACVIAVGPDFTALFTDDDTMATDMMAAAEAAGEGYWRLPLHAAYKSMLKADWAQIKNVGGRDAGATTAALFLQHFVDGPAWAHLDIAGSSFHEKGGNAYAAGATGEPVRSVINWIASKA